mmetsp:Transcript_34487/g.52775  ORF Transcript_34487/g.52775 Transcript_34487/m.52775 type:complete len:82 (-) Transcript_34487:2238-2483(-)
MHSIRPQVKAKSDDEEGEESEEPDEDIYLKDFIKIFRNDDVSDNLIKVINEEVNFRKQLAESLERKRSEKRLQQEQEEKMA